MVGLSGAISGFAVRNVRAVLPDRVVEDATVVAENGVVVSVAERGPAPPHAVDGRGAFCVPGLVDTHSDGLEKEVQPRPGVPFPYDFALGSFEGRVRAAGVTTVFHGVAFEENQRETRTVELARTACRAIEDRSTQDPLIDHRILHRLDARDPAGLAALRQRLAGRPTGSRPPPLVSFEDHTPGQGQYADPSVFRAHIEHTRGLGREEADEAVAQLTDERNRRLDQRDQAIAWLADQAGQGRVRLLAHDPASPAEIEDARRWGAAVAEFPTTVAAATAARESGLATVLGAPNVLRGGSHSGNVGAEELVDKRLCTALASDYMPSTLLAAAFLLARRDTTPLPAAIGLVTSGPATVAGLEDRGRLVPGGRADVVLVTVDGHWPTVRAVLQATARSTDRTDLSATSRTQEARP
jgi:alpha-D-ribose 1-methylphosphonate 5-triphosphate diphosphatase